MVSGKHALAAVLGSLALLVGTGCARATQARSNPPMDLTDLRQALRDVFMAQEIFYSNPENRYAYSPDATRLQQYRPRSDITVTIFEGTAQGWAGMVQSASGHACVMYVGKVSSIPRTPRGTSAKAAARGNNLEMECDAG